MVEAQRAIEEIRAQASQLLKPALQDFDFLQSFVGVGGADEDPESRRSRRSRPGAKPSRSSILASLGSRKSSPGPDDPEHRPKERRKKRRTGKRSDGKPPPTTSSRTMRRRKKRSSVRRQEEVYTDKDRAAAANMGSRDIKQSLRMKMQQDRSRALQIPEEAEPGAMLALGARELRSGDVTVAVGFINKALELSPGDKNALIARSKCHILLGEPQKALEDAEAALNEKSKEPCNARAMYCKAESLYSLGEFELSLVHYYRGMRMRPEFDGFRLGVQKAQEAIQNIIGGNAAPITVVKASKNSDSKKPVNPPEERVDEVKAAGGKQESRDSAKRDDRSSDVEKRRAGDRNLLGRMNVDRKYLQSLLKHPDVKAPHQASARHITTFAEEGIAFLKTRQEFWRQQRAS